jgi:hypothetical protein
VRFRSLIPLWFAYYTKRGMLSFINFRSCILLEMVGHDIV